MSETAAPQPINLSLISHTNVGKTTLIRTLIGQDVGEVRDAAHVTDTATGYVMLQAGDDTLMLWDTPGFGDTARLLKRLRLSSNPLGWLLSQVWDRFRERALWSSQQAVRNAREEADVILYLVNASEDPADAPYVPLEMEILAWIGKPVLLLLNQVGPPTPGQTAEEDRWRAFLADVEVVKGALTLDAFARCWVQENTLLRQVTPLLPAPKHGALQRLEGVWRDKNLARFERSMAVLGQSLAAVITDKEPVPERNWQDKVSGVIGTLRQEEPPEARRAMAKLAERLNAGTRGSTEQLIRIHGLSGRATKEVLKRLERDYSTSAPAKEGVSALLGGLVSGAAGGLAADVAAGGLTLGGGMIVGGVLGALGATGLARTYNMARGEEGTSVRWSEPLLLDLFQAALLRYLAVAHFGRGRGEFEEGEHPKHWQDAIAEVVEPRRGELHAIWENGRRPGGGDSAGPLERMLAACARELLIRFYPDARAVFG